MPPRVNRLDDLGGSPSFAGCAKIIVCEPQPAASFGSFGYEIYDRPGVEDRKRLIPITGLVLLLRGGLVHAAAAVRW